MLNRDFCFDFLQIDFEEKKKSEGKKARDDKEKVQDMLFAAFEKHQYYNIKDLVKLTNQPVVIILIFISLFFLQLINYL